MWARGSCIESGRCNLTVLIFKPKFYRGYRMVYLKKDDLLYDWSIKLINENHSRQHYLEVVVSFTETLIGIFMFMEIFHFHVFGLGIISRQVGFVTTDTNMRQQAWQQRETQSTANQYVDNWGLHYLKAPLPFRNYAADAIIAAATAADAASLTGFIKSTADSVT